MIAVILLFALAMFLLFYGLNLLTRHKPTFLTIVLAVAYMSVAVRIVYYYMVEMQCIL